MSDSRRIATVSQINNYIKALLDQMPVLQNIWIKGEISNFKRHSSGHLYLTLKDGGAVLKAVMFRNAAANLKFDPADGTKVLARGRISVYEAGGQYQMYIEEMEADGLGDLYAKFEALKKQLSEEGLFDEDRKKPIPKFPETIGIVTSPTGAAVRDMINVIKRRCPMVKVIIYPCLVQGENAAQSIAAGIKYFNENKMLLKKYGLIVLFNILSYLLCNFYFNSSDTGYIIMLLVVFIFNLFVFNYKEKQKAESIKNNKAPELAFKNKVSYKYNSVSRTPYFRYKIKNKKWS